MEYEPKGVTLEDLHGEVFEHEAYQDAVDKEVCASSCYFSYMDIHKISCPLFSGLDEKKWDAAQSGIDIARGK